MPMTGTTKGSLPKGRKQTDKSLGAERAKTDASLLSGRQQTESQADEAVTTSRADADETRSQNRQDTDFSSALDRAATGGSGSVDCLEADERLRKEREIADEALDAERRHVDSILAGEREQKRVDEHGFFAAERAKTDIDLTNERSETDVEVQRAVVALTTRDEFLAIVSHDLRNPLGSVAMAAQILKDGPSYSAADKETREYFDIIERSASEALRLIGDLMDMERISAGKLGLQIAPGDITEVIRHSVESFQHQARAKAIALTSSSDGRAIKIPCDRGRISQVLSNLLGNALKFTPSGGRVTLAVDQRDRAVQISIADTGPGISEDMHKTIFGRFWQIGKQDRRGLGLGLYISKMIVEAHHGNLWVESKPGHGSVFRFTLPCA